MSSYTRNPPPPPQKVNRASYRLVGSEITLVAAQGKSQATATPHTGKQDGDNLLTGADGPFDK
ncbi:hypothetical protein CLAIMM_13204 [Cladophialophora immunda]|nr:hypothetical protein CLAIMM_13204 [Cladophialophora immunda]